MKTKTATRTKITALLLVLVTITTMLPLSAFADDSANVTEYPLWIGGVRVTSLNCEDIPVQKGKASYDPIRNVLYLENAEISTYEVAGSSYKFGIYCDRIVVVYSGINRIIGSPGYGYETTGVYCLEDVAFEAADGESELNVDHCGVGVCSESGRIGFFGGKVDLSYSGAVPYHPEVGGVISRDGTVEVRNGAGIIIRQEWIGSVLVPRIHCGFYSRKGFDLDPGCSIRVDLVDKSSSRLGDKAFGVYSHDGDITIGGDAHVCVIEHKNENRVLWGNGLYAYGRREVIINGGNVDVSAEFPVFGDSGVVFGGGSVDLAAGDIAVVSNGDIKFTEGLLGFRMAKVDSDFARDWGAVRAGNNKEVAFSEDLLITLPAGGRVSDDKTTFVDSNGSPATELEIKPLVSYYISRNNGAEEPFALDRANRNVIDCAVGETVSLRVVCNSADHWLTLEPTYGQILAAEFYKEYNYVRDAVSHIKEYTVTFSPPNRSESAPYTGTDTVALFSKDRPGTVIRRDAGSYMFNTLKGDLTAEIKDVVVPRGGQFSTDLVLKTALGEETYPSVGGSEFITPDGFSLGFSAVNSPFKVFGCAKVECPAGDYTVDFTVRFSGDVFNSAVFRLKITVTECRCDVGEGLIEHPEKKATCVTPGNIHFWECADCGRLFYDEHGKTELTDRDSAFFVAAHDWAEQAKDEYIKTPANCGAAAVYHISCRVCGITAKALAEYENAFDAAVPGSSDTVKIDGAEFHVLAKENGRALLLAKDAAGTAGTFNDNYGVGWRRSDIRRWLNGEWLDGMTWLKAHAVTTDIKTSAAADNVNGEFITTHDRVFLLSEADVFGTQNGKPAREDDFTFKGATLPAPGGSWLAEYEWSPIDWWLRSPSMFYSTVAGVKTDGSYVYLQNYSSPRGVRPAVWVEYKTQDRPAAETFTHGDPLAHEYGKATYVWSKDNSACTATRVCVRNGCGHEESETAKSTGSQTTDPTCTEKGQYTYTATFTKEYFETQYEYQDIPPLEGDHEWQLEGWTWDYPNLGRSIAFDDYEAYPEVTLKLKCSKCGDSVSVMVDKPELQLLAEGDACNGGKRSFIATVNYEGVEYSDKNTFETINGQGHEYCAPTYVWSKDKSACTATRVCVRGCGHEETETASSSGSQTTDPKCGVEGVYTYTAEFTNPAFAKQTATVPVAALAHEYGKATYVWSKDNSACTATRVCVRGCGHEETETASSSGSQTTDPKCGVEGVYTFTAEFTNPAFAKQTATVPVAALTHEYGKATYVWSKDKSACTATRVCLRNGCGHEETEKVESVKTLARKPECENKGEYLYTAEFENSAFEKQTNSDEISADGHTPGKAVVENRVEPGCERDGGYDEVIYCAVCKKELSRTAKTVKAKGHKWGEWTRTKAPTDREEGEEARFCLHDGSHKQTRKTDKVKYEVSLDGGAENGRGNVTIEPSAPVSGDKVVLKPQPDGDSRVISVKIMTGNGEEIPYTESDDGTYSFVMPESDVEIKVEFAPKPVIEVRETEGGRVKLLPEKPDVGEKVVIEVAPEENNEVEKVNVIDKNNGVIPVEDNGDGTYSFVMPDGDVTVDVVFKKGTETRPQESEGSQNPQETEETQESDTKIPVYIGSGVLIAAVIAVLLLLLKRKRNKDN